MSEMITYQQPIINFDQYGEYLQKAEEVASYINAIQLTDDNVKEAKKELAAVRKLVNELSDRRIQVKKKILEPYEVLDAQIKEITGIINSADQRLRQEIRELEEQERESKKEAIREIWEKRIRFYTFPLYVSDAFNMWLIPSHLNKSTPISRVEKEMVDFMEQVESEVTAILHMPDSIEIITEYSSHLDITKAIEDVRKREEYKDEITSKTPEEIGTFIISGLSNIKFVEMLLQQNHIEYKRR